MLRADLRGAGSLRAFALVTATAAAFGIVAVGCGSPGDFDASPSTGVAGPRAEGNTLSVSDEDVERASSGCMTCHTGIEHPSMHRSQLVRIGCVHCHGGDASITKPENATGARPYGPGYRAAMGSAHVHPKYPKQWNGSRNPERSYALLNRESTEFVRFVNPGDLRVVHLTCGPCHPTESRNVPTSMMAHSAMVPGSGMYDNGTLHLKRYAVGEFYMPSGAAANAKTEPPPTEAEIKRGVLPGLVAYPRFESFQPGLLFRVLERGIANTRGLGTQARTDAVVLTATKTRLNDPNLWFLGTNDLAGEYRSGGCSACHVTYANDDGPNSGPWAKYGRKGTTASGDPTIPKDESGHPIEHAFTRSIPTSQCLTCHVHQGSGGIGGYAGEMWWDSETDGALFYNADGSKKSGRQLDELHVEANKKAKQTEFLPTHRGTWTFRKVFRRDLDGKLLDKNGDVVAFDDPDWAQKAVHLADAHFKAGMHCIDCHTSQDAHGDGKLYGEMMNAIEIDCNDCHGSVSEQANLVTSNPAGGRSLADAKTPFGNRKQFERRGGVLYQRSMVDPDVTWVVPQVKDMVDPANAKYNPRAARAKLVRKDGTAGSPTTAKADLAHTDTRMTCYSCHTSWAMSCAGCHLAQRVNQKTQFLHYWGDETRNDVGYYAQGLRTDMLILGFHGSAHKGRIGPVRSASSVVATAENGNRATVVSQQPTISSPGFSGSALSPYTPHTVSGKYDQKCSACHVSEADDNNAMLSVLFGTGVHAVDFVGEWQFVASESNVTGIRVTEGWEPQPVIGSDLHAIAQPASAKAFVVGGRKLTEGYSHRATRARTVQRRGENLFVADGPGGFRVLDSANIANKDVAQRIITAPFSPLGQDAQIAMTDATAVILPTVAPMDPRRKSPPENEEATVHPMFGYAFVTDSQEGLVVVDVNTFVDGDPDNNFIERAATFGGDGQLAGARGGIVVGHYLYVLCNAGIAVVDIDKPTEPKFVTMLSAGLRDVRAIDVQFRYAAVCDADGMKVLDLTEPGKPVVAMGVAVPLADARGVRICRTYAYVAAGKDGLAVIDVRRFRQPRLVETFDADGAMNDTTAVTTGMTNAGLYAYVADGVNGMRVVELWSPSRVMGTDGFSPPPAPRLIATYRTDGPAVGISVGLVRDRGVDESGNQISVFGRLGSRPLDDATRRKMYLRDGRLWTVRDDESPTDRK